MLHNSAILSIEYIGYGQATKAKVTFIDGKIFRYTSKKDLTQLAVILHQQVKQFRK